MNTHIWQPYLIIGIIAFLASISMGFKNVYPTSIPYIDNQIDCDKFNREWKDGKCWDNKHNPLW
jgi:hypothetical protein